MSTGSKGFLPIPAHMFLQLFGTNFTPLDKIGRDLFCKVFPKLDTTLVYLLGSVRILRKKLRIANSGVNLLVSLLRLLKFKFNQGFFDKWHASLAIYFVLLLICKNGLFWLLRYFLLWLQLFSLLLLLSSLLAFIIICFSKFKIFKYSEGLLTLKIWLNWI